MMKMHKFEYIFLFIKIFYDLILYNDYIITLLRKQANDVHNLLDDVLKARAHIFKQVNQSIAFAIK